MGVGGSFAGKCSKVGGEEVDPCHSVAPNITIVWEELTKKEGDVAVAKLGCVKKEKLGVSLKARMVTDLRRNGCNSHVRS